LTQEQERNQRNKLCKTTKVEQLVCSTQLRLLESCQKDISPLFLVSIHLSCYPVAIMLNFSTVLFLLCVRAVWGHDTNGAVASESAICTQIGIDIMKKGGNAADAVSSILSFSSFSSSVLIEQRMVGTQICIGTVTMNASGI
jgi:hypothetical protein